MAMAMAETSALLSSVSPSVAKKLGGGLLLDPSFDEAEERKGGSIQFTGLAPLRLVVHLAV